MPKVVGRVDCFECKREIDLKENKGGRFYHDCSGKAGCLAHHRYNPDIATPEDVPGFKPLRKETAPVADVRPEPSPVPKHQAREKEIVVPKDGNDGGNLGFIRW